MRRGEFLAGCDQLWQGVVRGYDRVSQVGCHRVPFPYSWTSQDVAGRMWSQGVASAAGATGFDWMRQGAAGSVLAGCDQLRQGVVRGYDRVSQVGCHRVPFPDWQGVTNCGKVLYEGTTGCHR